MSAGAGIGAALLVGAAYGAADTLVNSLSLPYGLGAGIEGTPLAVGLELLSIVIDAGWAWAGLAIGIGWLLARSGPRPTWLWGAVAGAAVLVAATAAYYLLKDALNGESPATHLVAVFVWSTAAVILGPLLGVVGAWIRQPGVVGWLASLVLPVGALVQMAVVPPGRTELLATTGRIIVGTAAVALIVVVTAHRRAS